MFWSTRKLSYIQSWASSPRPFIPVEEGVPVIEKKRFEISRPSLLACPAPGALLSNAAMIKTGSGPV